MKDPRDDEDEGSSIEGSGAPASKGKQRLSTILFKRRDHLPGWRARRFVLEGGILQYELLDNEEQEQEQEQDQRQQTQKPRGALDLSKCTVSGPILNTSFRSSDGQALYVFKAHVFADGGHKRESTWCLGTPNLAVAEEWVEAMRIAAGVVAEEEGRGEAFLSPLVVDSGDERREDALLSCEEDSPQSDCISPLPAGLKKQCRREAFLSEKELEEIQSKLCKAAAELLSEAANKDGWVHWFEARGVSAVRKRCKSRGLTFFMGSGIIHHTPASVLEAATLGRVVKKWDPGLQLADNLLKIDSQTFVDRFTWHQSWPKANRYQHVLRRVTTSDLGNMVVTCVDAPTFVTLCNSCRSKLSTAAPLVEEDCSEQCSTRMSTRNFRPALLELGGWILRPLSHGKSTHVTYVMRGTHLKLPFRTALGGSRRSPLAIAAIRQYLDSIYCPNTDTSLLGSVPIDPGHGGNAGGSGSQDKPRKGYTFFKWHYDELDISPHQRRPLLFGACLMAWATCLHVREGLAVDIGLFLLFSFAMVALMLHTSVEPGDSWQRSDWLCFTFTIDIPVSPLTKFISRYQQHSGSLHPCTVVHLVLKACADASVVLQGEPSGCGSEIPLVAYSSCDSLDKQPIDIYGGASLDIDGYRVQLQNQTPKVPARVRGSFGGWWLNRQSMNLAKVLVLDCSNMAELSCTAVPRAGLRAPTVCVTIGGIRNSNSPERRGGESRAFLRLSAVVQPQVGASVGNLFIKQVRMLLSDSKLSPKDEISGLEAGERGPREEEAQGDGCKGSNGDDAYHDHKKEGEPAEVKGSY